ncbi:MAG: hypothetical protein U9R57_03430 [Thermodesulfobacteriota bacterium]|nr:hypothetical protein [Thermodesulfobacteriota bacterium]
MNETLLEEVPSLIRRLKERRSKMDSDDYHKYVSAKLGDALSLKTIQGHAFHKPHGYAGDYEIIDKIYTKWLSPELELQVYDKYFHKQEAPKAVRNRKKYFIDIVRSLAVGKSHTAVLNIGSGPGRDMLEYFLLQA